MQVAARRTIPFAHRPRVFPRGLRGMGDDDYASYADTAFASTYEATGDYAQAEAARQAYLNASNAGPVAEPAVPYPTVSAPVSTPTPSQGSLLSSSDLVKLATVGMSAYVASQQSSNVAATQQKQAAYGIAPPGYSFYGRAPSLSTFNTAYPGYQQSGYMQSGNYPVAAAAPRYPTGYFAGNGTLILMAGIAALVMFEEGKGHKGK